MTEVLRTAATWPTVLRQTVQPHRVYQREPPWPRPPTAVAAELSMIRLCRLEAERSHSPQPVSAKVKFVTRHSTSRGS